jgi:hypothetical protein
MRYLEFKWELGTERVYISISQYMNGNLYVGLGPDFCDVTINISKLDDFEGCIDIPNVKELPSFLNEYGIAVDTGRTIQSGFNTYPIYKFNKKKLMELNKKELQIYLDGIE